MTSKIKGPLIIAGMEVENFMKVKVVRLKPDGSLIEIAGDNENGKTSLLNAIWVALGGADAFPTDPIRDDQQEALIKLDLGEIRVTRKFRRKEGSPPYTTTLVIEAASGARLDKPQTILDGLVGKLTFEPMGFMDLTDKEKFAALRVFVPEVDFDAIEGQNQSDYDKRTDENRRAKELAAQAAGIIVPEKMEVQRIDVTQVVADLEAAELHNQTLTQRVQRRQAVEDEAGRLEAESRKIEARIVDLQKQIEKLWADMREAGDKAAQMREKLAEAPPLPEAMDTAALRAKITEAQTVNADLDKYERKMQLLSQAEQHEAASKALTDAIEARKENVRAKIASAKMPVQGLSLEDGGRILLNGHPFADASTAERLRTSIAVAMAMNPTIRIIRITKGGNDLDKKSMKIVADMAAEHGYQVWIEVLEAKHGPAQIIMEDGHAKG